MRNAVLGALARHRPVSQVVRNLLPRHTRDFAATLARHDQQPDDRSR
jgi:hypothetical protein